MDFRKLALMVGVAASCTGCVTETRSLGMTDNVAKLKDVNIKETAYAARDPKAQTWVAVGQLEEAKLVNQKLPETQQNICRDEARKAYQKAIELNPKSVEAYSHLANLYAQVDDLDRAIAVYERALVQVPKSASLWHEQGLTHCLRKDYNAALQCLAKAHDLDPQKHDYATHYGYCLAWAGKPQEAVAALSSVMNKADANYTVARMLAHVNQPELSRQYATTALNDRPTHPEALALITQLNNPRSTQTAPVANLRYDPNFQQASMQTPR